MGFRFRRSARIAKGVRLNFGAKSASVSLGGRGARWNIGTRGSRATFGIPGTGLSYASGTRLGCLGVIVWPLYLLLWPALKLVDFAWSRLQRPAVEEDPRASQLRWDGLCNRFGVDAARAIWNQQLWVGAPTEAVSEMFGPPAEVAEVRGAGIQLKYFPDNIGAFGLRVFVSNGCVTHWTTTS